MTETMNVFKEVFQMPDEYKQNLFSNDPSKPCKMFTSSINYDTEKDGEWIAVEALPHAFVINVGYQLQIISNGKLKSSEHRAVTNSDHARTSAAFFVAPSDEIGVAVRSGKMPNPTLNEADEGKEWFEL
ncbi:protein DOWNY MILDEW RESISTANCE [Trifolium repens]|nr:protein DOWNY MILDEW RESISTANCE [Trifolium repens]